MLSEKSHEHSLFEKQFYLLFPIELFYNNYCKIKWLGTTDCAVVVGLENDHLSQKINFFLFFRRFRKSKNEFSHPSKMSSLKSFFLFLIQREKRKKEKERERKREKRKEKRERERCLRK